MTQPPGPTATALPEFDLAAVVDLDVRDDLRAGREPLARIIAAAEGLPAGTVLHVRTPFPPTPLFKLLAGRGMSFNTQGFANDDWSSWFWRGPLAPAPAEPATPPLATTGAWDLRPFPAPQPLGLLLEKVGVTTEPFDALLPGFSAVIPALLADQGWGATVTETAPDGVRVRIARLGGTS